jgi:long-chain acyl-CoA synthetase
MLTHRNVVADVKAVLQRVAPTDDVFLSFLPLSHTFERTVGYYLPIGGSCVAYARSVAQLPKTCARCAPRCWCRCRASTSGCTPSCWSAGPSRLRPG